MIKSEKNILLTESEVKPNKYSLIVLGFLFVMMLVCWITNELGIFRVGKWEMRIGAAFPLLLVVGVFVWSLFDKKFSSRSITKYVVLIVATLFTTAIHTMVTFHTTMMLLLPIFVAMLYKSKRMGFIAFISSILITFIGPILSYVLNLWDVPLFEELILISKNSAIEILDPHYGVTVEGIVKILLYLVFPRILMVTSCSFLMFYTIKRGEDNIKNQILLDQMNRRDNVTKLYNQNYFKELVESGEKHGKVGIIYFDVNGLKSLNDKYGHELGDILLQRCAKSINDICLNDEENGFRIGGDEFVFILENATPEALSAKVLLWKEKLELINKENAEVENNIVCSMAYGTSFGDMVDIENLLKIADSKMYQKKQEMKEGRE